MGGRDVPARGDEAPARGRARRRRRCAPRSTRASSRRGGRSRAPTTRSRRCSTASTLDALLVLTPNKNHHASVMAGLERGLHILCEKPLGMSAREAREMTEAAERAGVTTMTSFTYRFMPANRYLKALVDEGYIGRPYHLNLRYYAGYGRSGEYAWRFDVGESGGGVSGDLASHWGDHARWLFGEIEAVTAVFSYDRASRPATRRCAVRGRRGRGDAAPGVRERRPRLDPRHVARVRAWAVRPSPRDGPPRERRHAATRERLADRPAESTAAARAIP